MVGIRTGPGVVEPQPWRPRLGPGIVGPELGDHCRGGAAEKLNGDVAPRAILKGPSTMLIAPRGAVLNLKDQEMYVIDKVQNGFYAFALERILR